ncbi:MAG: hypothetical protein KGL39_00325 [Patescibacteria group bacterium]|nr:hypothetical protein [Patescibacteria group bacterium]
MAAVLDSDSSVRQDSANQVLIAIQNCLVDVRNGLGAPCCQNPTANGCDQYRWNQWVPIVFDWCRPLLTTQQVHDLVTAINPIVRANMQQRWGGPAMVGCDYFWSNLNWEWSWAAATRDLQDVSDIDGSWQQRWQNFLQWTQNPLNGLAGIFPAGSQYGLYCYNYCVLPFLSDPVTFTAPAWFAATVNTLAQQCSSQPVNVEGGGSYYQILNFQDDETGNGFVQFDRDNLLPDYLYAMQEILAGTPQAGYAAQLLSVTGAVFSPWLGYSVAPVTPQPLNTLPLVTPYGPWLIIRQGWDSDATIVFISLNHGSNFGPECGGHEHADLGSFAVLKGNSWRIKNQAGYATNFNGGNVLGMAIPAEHFGCNGVPFVDYGGGYISGSINALLSYTVSDDGDLVTVTVTLALSYGESPVRIFQYRRSTDTLTINDNMPMDNATDYGTPHVRFPFLSQPIQTAPSTWQAPEGVTLVTNSSTYPVTYESGYYGTGQNGNPNMYGYFLDVIGQNQQGSQQMVHTLTFVT